MFGYLRRLALSSGGDTLLAVLACCLLVYGIARAQDDRGVGEPSMYFDLPSQTLTTALRQYAEHTGKSLFFDTALTGGKQSAPLQGEFTASAALAILLQDSGLVVKNTSASAFTLVAQDPLQIKAYSADAADAGIADQGTQQDIQTEAQQDWRRARRIQAALETSLCRDGMTYPGTYRALIRVWLDTQGRVRRGGLLGSTGLAARDQAIGAVLQGLAIGPQDAAMPDLPVIILLLPRTIGAADVCLAAGQGH